LIPIHLVFGALLVCSTVTAVAQKTDDDAFPFVVDSITIEALDLFEGTTPWPVLGPVMDFFHVRTRAELVREEIFIEVGDTIWPRDVDEQQFRLRNAGAFADIRIECAPAGHDEDDVRHGRLRIQTRDTWSILLYASYTRAQDETAWAIAVTDFNLFGTLNRFGIGVDYSSLGDRGNRWYGTYRNTNVLGSFMTMDLAGVVGRNETSATLNIGVPFYSDRVRNGFAIGASYLEGKLPAFPHDGSIERSVETPLTTIDAGAWFSRSNGGKGDVFRWSAALSVDRTTRDTLAAFAKAFENTARAFVGISSIRRRFTFVQDADFNGERQIPIGAFGDVSIGKIAPHAHGSDNVVYVGFDAGRAVRTGNVYAIAEAAAGTGFRGRQTSFTTFRWMLGGALLTNPGAVVLRVDQSTVWNWPRYLVSFASGGLLRGYERQDLASDNKFIVATEYRLNPIVRILAFDLGAAVFYELGGYWNQGQSFESTRFHSSAGIGLRVGYAGSRFGKGLLRADLAWNFDRGRFSKLLIGTEEAFDIFGTLEYRPPGPLVY